MERDDSFLRPFKIIPGAPPLFFFCSHWSAEDGGLSGGVHHWDENGVKNTSEEPDEIRRIHSEMIEFVKAWLDEWRGAPAVVRQSA